MLWNARTREVSRAAHAGRQLYRPGATNSNRQRKITIGGCVGPVQGTARQSAIGTAILGDPISIFGLLGAGAYAISAVDPITATLAKGSCLG